MKSRWRSGSMGRMGFVFGCMPGWWRERLRWPGGVALKDTEAIGRRRKLFAPEETAWRAPEVLRGEELSSTTFWHGRLMSERARRWVAYQTGGRGQYAITAMEDAGILTALKGLCAAGFGGFLTSGDCARSVEL